MTHITIPLSALQFVPGHLLAYADLSQVGPVIVDLTTLSPELAEAIRAAAVATENTHSIGCVVNEIEDEQS